MAVLHASAAASSRPSASSAEPHALDRPIACARAPQRIETRQRLGGCFEIQQLIGHEQRSLGGVRAVRLVTQQRRAIGASELERIGRRGLETIDPVEVVGVHRTRGDEPVSGQHRHRIREHREPRGLKLFDG